MVPGWAPIPPDLPTHRAQPLQPPQPPQPPQPRPPPSSPHRAVLRTWQSRHLGKEPHSASLTAPHSPHRHPAPGTSTPHPPQRGSEPPPTTLSCSSHAPHTQLHQLHPTTLPSAPSQPSPGFAPNPASSSPASIPIHTHTVHTPHSPVLLPTHPTTQHNNHSTARAHSRASTSPSRPQPHNRPHCIPSHADTPQHRPQFHTHCTTWAHIPLPGTQPCRHRVLFSPHTAPLPHTAGYHCAPHTGSSLPIPAHGIPPPAGLGPQNRGCNRSVLRSPRPKHGGTFRHFAGSGCGEAPAPTGTGTRGRRGQRPPGAAARGPRRRPRPGARCCGGRGGSEGARPRHGSVRRPPAHRGSSRTHGTGGARPVPAQLPGAAGSPLRAAAPAPLPLPFSRRSAPRAVGAAESRRSGALT